MTTKQMNREEHGVKQLDLYIHGSYVKGTGFTFDGKPVPSSVALSMAEAVGSFTNHRFRFCFDELFSDAINKMQAI